MIKVEGNEIVLYSQDGSQVLGRFAFGEGEEYPDEATAHAAAEARELEIQTLAHAAESLVSPVPEEGLEEPGEVISPSPPSVIDYLVARVHRAFTVEADEMLAGGTVVQDERIALSNCIGAALDVFNATADELVPQLRSRPAYSGEVPFVASVRQRRRALTDTWDRQLTESRVDEQGNLHGIVLIEGRSENGNVYTVEALESAIAVFANRPIYADHPTKTEQRERPERSVRDLVGSLPSADNFWVGLVKEGQFAGRHALFYRNGRLSKTADWLATLIQEKIAGAQSINAVGAGHWDTGNFIVEAFTDAISLDFVTRAAAGGQGQLQESSGVGGTARDVMDTDIEEAVAAVLAQMTLTEFAQVRPDILNHITQREKDKVYRQRKTESNKEDTVMTKQAQVLEAQVQALRQDFAGLGRRVRQMRAGRVIDSALAESTLPKDAQRRVRQLIEGRVQRFVLQEQEDGEAIDVAPIAPVGDDLDTGDAPTIELPPDVAELNEDLQALWLTTYTEEISAGTSETDAVHIAWTAVVKAAEGTAEEEELPPTAEELADEDVVVTEEALARMVKAAIRSEAAYLARHSNAGRITGLGGRGGDSATTETDSAQLEEAFGRLLPESQVTSAVKGRSVGRRI
ncbi:MAG: hypothetical protein DRJ03_08880 [Chloroflexi bacterium]|nr:MAG: hypothetical protein DRJ03_08880 [Chloroflexota bacterium]